MPVTDVDLQARQAASGRTVRVDADFGTRTADFPGGKGYFEVMTQDEYAVLATPDPNTAYFIIG